MFAQQAPEAGPVGPPDRRPQSRIVPVTAALFSMIIGLSDILEVIIPGYHARLRRIHAAGMVPGSMTAVTSTAVVITGLLLLMLSHALRRRKRRAWQAVIALLTFNIVIHLMHGPHITVAVVSLVVLGALLYFNEHFYARGDPRTRWSALWAFGALAVMDVAIGLGYMLLARGLARDYTIAQRLQAVVYGLFGFSGQVQFVPEYRNDLFDVLTSALGLVTLIITVYLFLRPAEPKARLRERDAARIRQLLACHGERDSLGYFALRHDKSVVWSPTGKACVCYRVVSGVMLASADPIGDPEAWPGAIHAFLDEAAEHAWVPAVMGCSELAAEIWCRETGLTALELGDEAIVSVVDFSLSGRVMRNVRQMVSRVARNGYTAQVRRVGDIPRQEIECLIRQADSWRGTQTERGFSMALGRVGALGDEDCVLATATQGGVVRAMVHFAPWGGDGLSLDLMRRDKGSQPGLNDFLLVETIKAAPALGVKRLSLNFAVFRAALERGERIGAGPVLRAWRNLLLFASKWFQIESLYKFNAKFQPAWQPRFFVFPGTRYTPRVALAALEAEAFLVWPHLNPRHLARSLGLGKLKRRLRARAGPRRAA
ncbi:MAG TPA: phosphatidylglycerol lysyltransferase domain-containing protein [Streptosporangiaceae bacterium]|nr:phosphatidylglycerol lysyltransferase domain-containing protein [Streptosporangiaceae bacterium]